MLKVNKGDIIQITKGKDRGKKGKVLQINLEKKRALIEGLNMVKKHKRKTRQDQQGGIISIESPIAIANIMYYCKACERPVRLGITVQKDGAKTRFCKACKQTV